MVLKNFHIRKWFLKNKCIHWYKLLLTSYSQIIWHRNVFLFDVNSYHCVSCLTPTSDRDAVPSFARKKRQAGAAQKSVNYSDFCWWHFPAAYGGRLMGEQRFLMNTWVIRTKGQCCCLLFVPCEMIMWPQQDFEANKLLFLAARMKNNYCCCALRLLSECQPFFFFQACLCYPSKMYAVEVKGEKKYFH